MATQPSPSLSTSLRNLVGEGLSVSDPDIAGSLCVFPIFGGEGAYEYSSFADGLEHGAKITELDGAASVRDLIVTNPTPLPLLLYEGEEVLGAQQNRTLDLSVMVGPSREARIPVSCVEQGRWDGQRHRESFERAPQAAYPELRRNKARQARQSKAAGFEARADQSLVWNEVAQKAARHGVRSSTGAMHDVFEGRRSRLAELAGSIGLREGQTGMLAAIDGHITVLDWVSRPSVFADLFAPLIQGYALDAVERKDACSPPGKGEAEGFLALALESRPRSEAGVGLGKNLAFDGQAAEGSGLEVDGQLVQLMAFPATPRSAPATGTVRRPSRRRM